MPSFSFPLLRISLCNPLLPEETMKAFQYKPIAPQEDSAGWVVYATTMTREVLLAKFANEGDAAKCADQLNETLSSHVDNCADASLL